MKTRRRKGNNTYVGEEEGNEEKTLKV